jgi:hypothetical protein
MIDRITFIIKHFDFGELEARLKLETVGISGRTSASIYGTTINNLKFIVYSSTVKVSGSLHKYSKGNNYSLFTYKEAQLALQEISKISNIPLDEFIVTSIEIEINLPMVKDPKEYLKIIHSYKSLDFISMTPLSKTSQIRGVRCRLSEYDIKFYDKTFETIRSGKIKVADRKTIPPNIIRFEVGFSGKQLKTIGFRRMTGKSLQHPHHGPMLKKKLKLIFNEINFYDISANYSKMLEDDVKRYIFVMSNGYNHYLDYLKQQFGVEEYRKERRRTDSFLKKIEPLKTSELETELKTKFAETLLKI